MNGVYSHLEYRLKVGNPSKASIKPSKTINKNIKNIKQTTSNKHVQTKKTSKKHL